MSGTRYGLWTPRQALSELIRLGSQIPGEGFKVDRYKTILAHLEKAQFRDQPVADTLMSASAIDAVIKEAWEAAQHAPDPIETMIRHMAAQGRA